MVLHILNQNEIGISLSTVTISIKRMEWALSFITTASVMTYYLNGILLSFTTTATAVFGVYFKLQSLIFLPVFNLNNGMVPIIAYNLGAQKKSVWLTG